MPKRPRDMDPNKEEDCNMLSHAAWNPCHDLLSSTSLCEFHMFQWARDNLILVGVRYLLFATPLFAYVLVGARHPHTGGRAAVSDHW